MNKDLNRVLTVEAEAENEWIAGVPRSVLFEGSYWTGFKKIKETELFKMLGDKMEFRARTDELERDELFKQIIPYFLVRKENKFLMAMRASGGGDSRYRGLRFIGFGGHLRKGDIVGPMKDWLKREFDEELEVGKIKDINFIGIVNDDNDPREISKVHFGLVFLVDVDGAVEIKEKHKVEGEVFLSIAELKEKSGEMESWSRLVAESLE